MHADKIVAMQDGRIVEVGSHTDLLANRGLYYHLYKAQFEHALSMPSPTSGGKRRQGGQYQLVRACLGVSSGNDTPVGDRIVADDGPVLEAQDALAVGGDVFLMRD